MNWYGSDVENYGLIPTPVLAYNIKVNKLHAGFSITASHNPPEYAGVKVFGTDGIEFSLEAEHKVEQLLQGSHSLVKKGRGAHKLSARPLRTRKRFSRTAKPC